MGTAIGEILPLAIGVAVSPVPIIAVIMMLFSNRPRINSMSFLAGWVLTLAIVGTIVLLIADPLESSGSDEPSMAGAVIRIVLGAALLMLALKQWRNRPKENEAPKMPRWMNAIDSFTPAKSFGIAAMLAGVNPKNLGLTLGAAIAIAQVNLSGMESAISIGIFVIIASISVALPVILNTAMGEKASTTLGDWKQWLTQHNASVMFVLLLVIGFLLTGQGIRALTA